MHTLIEEPEPLAAGVAGVAGLAGLLAPLPRDRTASPRRLRALVEAVGRTPGLWEDAVRHEDAQRHYRRIWRDERVDVWVNTWPDGSETTLHDHGGSSGAYHVVSVVLTEDWVRRAVGTRRLCRRLLTAGTTSAFGGDHVHDVGSRDGSPAVSIHAYSPPLTSLSYYRLAEGGSLSVTGSKTITEASSW